MEMEIEKSMNVTKLLPALYHSTATVLYLFLQGCNVNSISTLSSVFSVEKVPHQ